MQFDMPPNDVDDALLNELGALGGLCDGRESERRRPAAGMEARAGYRLTVEEWQPKDAANQSRPSKHKSHGILWKVTHPVGATLGAARPKNLGLADDD
jgi:hypothetical protein